MSGLKHAYHGRSHLPGGSDPIPGSSFVRGPYRITKDDDLATGVDLFTPVVGDVLYDAFVVVKEAFDDSAPNALIPRLYVGATLWSHPLSNDVLDLGNTDDESGDISIGNAAGNPLQFIVQIAINSNYGRYAVVVLDGASVVIRSDAFNQDGSTGIADVYVVAGTPVP